jgi:hypothetical protein
MQTTRDSSIWRSLAVAFGDGVAFAAGMKLTQAAQRPATATPAPETLPLAGRLAEMEKRLASVIEKPALAPRPSAAPPEPEIALLVSRLAEMEKRLAAVEQKPAPAAAPPFDQKVIEAVVRAVDERLREQADQVEHKLAALETKIAADLKALRQQDHAIATAVENHLEVLQDHFVEHVEALRLQVEADRAAVRKEAAAAVAAASVDVMEEMLAPLRLEAAEKDRQIAELRQRLEDSDASAMELLNGIGQLIHQAAGRKAGAPAGEPPAEGAPEPSTAPPAAAESAQATDPSSDPSLPSFARPAKSGRLWRVPLVSSLLIAAGGTAGALLLNHW